MLTPANNGLICRIVWVVHGFHVIKCMVIGAII